MKVDEIKSIVPVDQVYKDALSPAMKQIGKALESVAKTSRFLMAPFDYLATQHDRWQRYLQKVSEKVDVANLTEGHPQIVIPTLEGLSLTYENSLLSEMFINLLANSIDKTKQDLAHPAFPNLIKQLSHDEAVLMYYLKKKGYLVKQQADYSLGENRYFNSRVVFEEFPIEKLQFPEHIWLYSTRLHFLNLAGTYSINQTEYLTDNFGNQVGSINTSERRLDRFGKLFADACIPDNFDLI
jgi:hypothetical protein